jgi:L-arabinose isomerase
MAAFASSTHHFALGVGHQARTLQKIADILGVESVIVTPCET